MTAIAVNKSKAGFAPQRVREFDFGMVKGIFFILLALILLFVVWKFMKGINAIGEGAGALKDSILGDGKGSYKDMVRTEESAIEKELRNTKQKLSYPESYYTNLANTLFSKMGLFDKMTKAEFLPIISQIRNYADYLKLQQAFGTKQFAAFNGGMGVVQPLTYVLAMEKAADTGASAPDRQYKQILAAKAKAK